MSTTTWPASRAACWAPRSVRPKNGCVTSRTTSPTADAVPLLSALAAALGRYPSSRAATRTASAVDSDTRPGALPDSTSDTVVCETPARLATSTLVTFRDRAEAAPETGLGWRALEAITGSHHARPTDACRPPRKRSCADPVIRSTVIRMTPPHLHRSSGLL